MGNVKINRLATLVINMTPDSQTDFNGDNTLLASYKKRIEDGDLVFPVSFNGQLIVKRIRTDEHGFSHIECDFRGLLEEER